MSNPYAEIEFCMQRHMKRPYIAKENDYRSLKQMLNSQVPLEWILAGIDRVFAERGEKAVRIRSFSYVAEILKDEWAKELVKREEIIDAIDFKRRAKISQNGYGASYRMKRVNAQADPHRQTATRDERYAAFYRLFPEET